MSDVVDPSLIDDEKPAKVPDGWTFFRAAELAHSVRKYHFNPQNNTRRLTLCQTLRELWLIADKLGDEEVANQIKMYVEVGFEIAKRIDRRQKDMRRRLGE